MTCCRSAGRRRWRGDREHDARVRGAGELSSHNPPRRKVSHRIGQDGDRARTERRCSRVAYLSSAVNFWIFLQAFSSCSRDVA